MSHSRSSPARAYDFLLKFLLVGDSDVGKGEILASLQDGAAESPYGYNMDMSPHVSGTAAAAMGTPSRSLVERLLLLLKAFTTHYWRGGRSSMRSLWSRPAGFWSESGTCRWIKEIDEHAPGVPKILVGNRLHLAYKRQVPTAQAYVYAEKLGVTFFEVSPLCNFNITESFTELARVVLMRHGMDRLWRPNKVLSLQELCCRSIVSCTPVHLVEKLPLPPALQSHLKSFSMANGLNARMMHGRSYSVTASSNAANNAAPATGGAVVGGVGGGPNGATKRTGAALLKKPKLIRPPPLSPSAQSCARNSCKIS
ncbi:unnamed protein product [Merluccius merluccius]